MTAALERSEWLALRPGRTLPRDRPGTHCTGGWVDPRAGPDERKISSPSGFDPGPSSSKSVAMPTELPGLHIYIYIYIYIKIERRGHVTVDCNVEYIN